MKKLLKDRKISIIFVSFIALFLLKLYMAMGLPLYMISSEGDDQLFINYAAQLLQGNWLGEYYSRTLNKMPGYGLFLTLPTLLHIPAHLLTELLYDGAILITVIAFRKVLDKWWKIIALVVYLLFSPLCFVSIGMIRLYRTALTPATALLIVASYSGLFLYRNSSVIKILGWSILAGFSTFFFWILREDSVWILPFVTVAGIITIGYMIYEKREHKLVRAAIVLLSYVIIMAGLNGIKAINYAHYGVYTLNNFNQGNFARAAGAVLSVQPETEKEFIWLDQATLKKITNQSATLKSIEPHIDYWMESWDSPGVYGIDGEVEKDYVVWALRDAGIASGYCSDAVQTEVFWGKVADELEDAISSGKLEKRKGISISNLALPITLEKLPKQLMCAAEGIIWANTYHDQSAVLLESDVPDENARRAEFITRDMFLYENSTEKLHVQGWIFNHYKEEPVTVTLLDKNDQVLTAFEVNSERNDVYNAYKDSYNTVSLQCGLSFSDDVSARPAAIQFTVNGDMLLKINTDDLEEASFPYHIKDENYTGAIEVFTSEDQESLFAKINDPCKLPNVVINLYRIVSIPMCVVAIAVFFLSWAMVFTRKIDFKENGEILIILSGVIGSYILLHCGVALNYYEAWNRKGRLLYAGASFPLQQLFIILMIIMLINDWEKRKRLKGT